LLGSSHSRVAEALVQKVAVHMLDVVEVELHSFASSMAALEVQADDCNLVADFFVPFGGHTLVLVAHVPVAPFLSLFPTSLVLALALATLSPFASIALSPVPSPFPAFLSRNHYTDYAFLHTQVCHMPSPLEALLEQQGPPFFRIGSQCALVDEDSQVIAVEVGH
jgi:hypothetical protein